MTFDPKAEPCHTCGREPEECICELAPDFEHDDPDPIFDDPDYLDSWAFPFTNVYIDEEPRNEP